MATTPTNTSGGTATSFTNTQQAGANDAPVETTRRNSRGRADHQDCDINQGRMADGIAQRGARVQGSL